MATILPTKELIQMIEERIPFGLGRFLTTTALVSAVLGVIVASCAYLYRAVILPLVTLIIAGLTTGKISRSSLIGLIGSMVFSALIFWFLEWAVRGSSRLMREVLDNSAKVLNNNDKTLMLAQQTNEQMREVARAVEDLDARVSTLENRPQRNL
jgi:hypothetical protein